GTLKGLDRGRVVVRFDLEGDGPAVGQPQHAGIFSRPLDDLWARGRKRVEDGARVLVGAVLAPQRRKDAQLGERWRSPQHRRDALVLFSCEVVLLHQLGGDLRIAHDRVTPFATARNIRAKMFGGVGRLRIASTSSASAQMPWQLVHWSI